VPARALADFHLVFNLLLALAFLPFLDGYARILTRLFPARESAEGVSDVRYRVPAERAGASGVLSLAIADVAHLMSLFDVLLGASEGALMHAKRDDMTRNKALCRRLRTLSRTMQASLSAVDIDGFSENDHRRLEAITKFIGNIHGATSIVERGLRQLIKSSWEKGTSIPAADHAFLKDVFDRVRENAWAAVGLLTNGGSDDELKHMCTAQWLSAQRDGFVELERQAKEHDVECLRAGLFDNAFRLDIIREMQSIHACLIADFDSIVECLGGLAMPMSPPGLRHN
jgi:phosphate:Na+ symporter